MIVQVNPNNFDCAKALIVCNVDRIAVGYGNLSTRTTCLLNKKQLLSLIKIAKKTKIYVLVNRFFFEHEIELLTKNLILLVKLGIHGIIFGDYAIPQILKENKITIPLVYDSPNMVTNYGQFDFFIKNKIGEVMLTPDLDKEEIKEIIRNKNKMKIQMHFAGLGYMFCSKWKLLTNFKQYKNKNNLSINKPFFIKEESRNEQCIIYEDSFGTSVFTKYSINLYSELNDLWKVDTIVINGFLQSNDWIMKLTKLFQKTIKTRKINNDVNKQIDKNQSLGFHKNKERNLRYLSRGNNE